MSACWMIPIWTSSITLVPHFSCVLSYKGRWSRSSLGHGIHGSKFKADWMDLSLQFIILIVWELRGYLSIYVSISMCVIYIYTCTCYSKFVSHLWSEPYKKYGFTKKRRVFRDRWIGIGLRQPYSQRCHRRWCSMASMSMATNWIIILPLVELVSAGHCFFLWIMVAIICVYLFVYLSILGIYIYLYIYWCVPSTWDDVSHSRFLLFWGAETTNQQGLTVCIDSVLALWRLKFIHFIDILSNLDFALGKAHGN